MKQKSGSISIAILCSCAILSKYLVILPEYMVKYVGNAAWLDVLAKCIIASISLSIVLWLYKPFAPDSVTRVFSLAFGKWGKVVISYFYIITFTLFNSLLLRLLAEALSTVMATTAPDEFFILFILISVFAAAYSGTHATSNLSNIIFPFVAVTIITVSLALFPHYRTDNLMPFFGESTNRLLHGIFVRHFGFAETILLFFFAPLLGSYKELKKCSAITYIVITLISVGFTLAYCLTVPYPASKNFFLPFYQMTRMIKSGAFLQRLEPIVVFVWTAFVMCSMSILICVTSKLASNSENQSEEKSFVPIITFITLFAALIPVSESVAFSFYERLLGISSLLFPAVPLVTLITARIRKWRATK